MSDAVSGEFSWLGEREYYSINNYDRLPPFFMTLVSPSDHWLFISSTGGLTLGRINADHALLPYDTVDKIHDNIAHTGPITLFKVAAGIWQPLDLQAQGLELQRRLSKHVLGTSLVFEERNAKLNLEFTSSWESSDRFGFVRRCTVKNVGSAAVELEVLDGLRNVLPTGIVVGLQQSYSSLADAYKTSELHPATGLGIYGMTSAISDRPEPQEALKCATIWQRGLPNAVVTLDANHVAQFRRGEAIAPAAALKGKKGSYLVTSKLKLAAGESCSWVTVAEVNQGQREVSNLVQLLATQKDSQLFAALAQDVGQGERELTRILGVSDGLQVGEDRKITAHHLANVLFNDMRGGVFADSYQVGRDDFLSFLAERNKAAQRRVLADLQALPASTDLSALLKLAHDKKDADLQRLVLEYLPITFSRRHGDPSRPWNRFNIRVKGDGGQRLLSYEGNWRDIFQNWEALCFSYPAFLPSVIAKFVNASTVDGFNPYRISRAGLDWEVPEPHDPWANIGYWGDHQIVYLLRLLEWADRFQPGKLGELLATDCFAYADVPYRIKPYADLVKEPKSSILFDREHHRVTQAREQELGTDGRLLSNGKGGVLHVNLAEKLLVPVMSKLSNFVIGGGIWLNTQRPEWNDANNALVGYASSMVTLYHMRRYLGELQRLLAGKAGSKLALSSEVATWLEGLQAAYAQSEAVLSQPAASDAARKALLDAVGEAFSKYREQVYGKGFSGRREVAVDAVLSFCKLAQRFVDHSIASAKRDNGLYDAYNLLQFSDKGVAVRRLYDMLEGQVSALSSGALAGAEVLGVLQKMEQSELYRKDQHSYLLYPARKLPGYLERNRVPAAWAKQSKLLTALQAAGNHALFVSDGSGAYFFNSGFGNAKDVQKALDSLKSDNQFSALVEAERDSVLQMYESVFHHAEFTGRSGTMYGYEGLGCIYWHMVAKLLLAVEEAALQAPAAQRKDLAAAYYRVRDGLCFNKTPTEYGTFPMDPYSHTPPFAGAQQPGMTGQVKEVVLARFAELGVQIENGCVQFRPQLLRALELLKKPAKFEYVALSGDFASVDLGAGELGFTYCQVPVVYRAADQARIVVQRGSATEEISGDALSAAQSAEIFGRTGKITSIRVDVPKSSLL
jgi:hypothetical protein